MTNRRVFYVYVFLMSFQLFTPTVALFFQNVGMSFTEIMLLQSVFVVTLTLLDVPTSAIADAWSRRNMFIIASLAAVSGTLVFYLSRTFIGLVIGEVFWGLSAAAIQGTDTAYVYDALANGGPPDKDEVQSVLANITSLNLAATGVASIVGALLAYWTNFATVFLWNAPFFAAAIILALSLREVYPTTQTPHNKKANPLTIVKGAFGSLVGDKVLLVVIVDVAVLATVARAANWYFQPLLRDSGVPVYAFGLVFAMMYILSAAIVQIAPALNSKLGSSRAMRATRAAMAILLIVLAWWHFYVVTILAILALISIVGIRRSLYRTYMSSRVVGGQIATVLSFAGLAGTGLFAVAGPVVGQMADRFGEAWALTLLAIVAATLALLWRTPAPDGESASSPTTLLRKTGDRE